MTRSKVFLSGLALLAIVAGCAKQPIGTTASTPAPTGVSGVTQPAVQPATGSTTSPSVRRGAATQSTTPSREPARVAPQEFTKSDGLRDIHFNFDKYDITPESAKTLDANAAWLRSNPKHLALIEGHCDERGTVEYNVALGERRATAAKNYLVAQGVQAGRVSLVSYGKERPVCTEKTEDCWAKNRRAAFLVKSQ